MMILDKDTNPQIRYRSTITPLLKTTLILTIANKNKSFIATRTLCVRCTQPHKNLEKISHLITLLTRMILMWGKLKTRNLHLRHKLKHIQGALERALSGHRVPLKFSEIKIVRTPRYLRPRKRPRVGIIIRV